MAERQNQQPEDSSSNSSDEEPPLSSENSSEFLLLSGEEIVSPAEGEQRAGTTGVVDARLDASHRLPETEPTAERRLHALEVRPLDFDIPMLFHENTATVVTLPTPFRRGQTNHHFRSGFDAALSPYPQPRRTVASISSRLCISSPKIIS